MWLWRKKPPPVVPTLSPVNDEIERRIAALEGAWKETRADWRRVEIEWEEWFGKFRRLLARIERANQRADDRQSAQDAPQTTIDPSAGVGMPRDRWQALKAIQTQKGA